VALDTIVQPAHLWAPEHASTSGAEAADFGSSAGITLDPEQRLALDLILAERADGRWSAFEAALVASRQNLKTFVFEVIVLADLYLFESELIVWTAHESSTAMEAFRGIKMRIETYPHLSKRVRKITEANGDEGIEFHGRQRLRFRARTTTGGRGLTGDRVILDEAQELTASMVGSLMPTMSAKSMTGNPQLLYGGSAGKPKSAVWRSIRDRGRAGDDPSLVYLEWCADRKPCGTPRCTHFKGSVRCQLDDPANWARSNPAMGRRISQDFIAAERRSLPPAEFARERMGWWEDPEESVGAGVPLDAWRDCGDRHSQIHAIQAFALDVAPDSEWSAIAVAGLREDGVPHVEVIENRLGTTWVADRLSELLSDHGPRPVVVDPKGPVRSILAEIADAGVTVTEAETAGYVTACESLVDRLNRRALRHIVQGELDTPARSAVRRPVGDSWVWSRKLSPVDISPLVAATLALWGAGLADGDTTSVYEERGLITL